MKYSETAIGKVHLTSMDGIISKVEYQKFYQFFKTIGVSSGIPIKDIIASLVILRHGIKIGEEAKKQKGFDEVNDSIKKEALRICELTSQYSIECEILKT